MSIRETVFTIIGVVCANIAFAQSIYPPITQDFNPYQTPYIKSKSEAEYYMFKAANYYIQLEEGKEAIGRDDLDIQSITCDDYTLPKGDPGYKCTIVDKDGNDNLRTTIVFVISN